MLQSIFRRTVYKNIPTVLIAKCSTRSENRLRQEINQVTLVGIVLGDQLQNDYGQKLIRVKTIDSSSGKYQIHTLSTTTPENYEDGQRVFVNGRLISREIMTSENKRRQQNIIKAFRMYPLNSVNEDKTKSIDDINAVEVVTNVCTDIVEKDDHSIIPVVTHYMYKLDQIEKQTNFHSIFVYDPDLCEIIRNNLKKSDRIYVRGSLRSHSVINADGRKYSSGFIVAETIDRLTKYCQNRPANQDGTEQMENQ